MKPHEPGVINKIGKAAAIPLSKIFANSLTAPLSELIESYLAILLGKGAGTAWAFDAEIKAAQFAITTSSPILFDVGANRGEWSSLMQEMYSGPRCFMFEPQPKCQGIITGLNIPNSVLIPNAVSSTKSSVTLYSPGETAGMASLHKRRDSYFSNKEFYASEVDTVTIDDIVKKYKLTTIDFMKMDIEGHEFDALKGALTSLENGVIKALSFEFGSGNINSRTFFHDFWDLLHPLGYQIYRILPSSRLMLINQYYEDCEHFRGVTNYIAILK